MGERIHIRRAHAVAWVKKNKVTKADKSEEDYIKRVKTIMEGGASSRSRLRSRKGLESEDDPFFKGDPADLVEVCLQARLYYRKEMGVHPKKPTKILDHKDYPALGRYYLLLWHDVGTGTDQDIEDWFSADFALTFNDLVFNYHKVFQLIAFIIYHSSVLPTPCLPC